MMKNLITSILIRKFLSAMQNLKTIKFSMIYRFYERNNSINTYAALNRKIWSQGRVFIDSQS